MLEVHTQKAELGFSTVNIDVQKLGDGTFLKTIEIQVALIEEDKKDQTNEIVVEEKQEN